MPEELEDENLPTVTCPECGEVMRLIGIERDQHARGPALADLRVQ
jgi:predicted RNA-binding Zn-ribbon protein involved in translation (DUF1610 family)